MGKRRNVKLEYGTNTIETNESIHPHAIYFYTHWDALHMPQKLQNALIRGKERWNDESYLARIIFSDLIKGEEMDITGYGIAPYEMDPNYPTIIVNLTNNTVDNIPFDEFIQMDIEHYRENNEE